MTNSRVLEASVRVIDILDTSGLQRRFTTMMSDAIDSHDRLPVNVIVADGVEQAEDELTVRYLPTSEFSVEELSVSISSEEHGVDGHDVNEPSGSGSMRR